MEKASNRARWNLLRDSRRVYRESGEMNGRGEGRSTLDETRLKERMGEKDGRGGGVNDNVAAFPALREGCFRFPYRGAVVDGELKGDYSNCYGLVSHVTTSIDVGIRQTE